MSSIFLGYIDSFQHTMEWVEPLDFVRCSEVCKVWYENSKAVEGAVFKPRHEQAKFKVENDMYTAKSFIVLKATTILGHPRDLTIKYVGVPEDEDPAATLKQIAHLCKFDNSDDRGPQNKWRNYQTHSAIIKYTAVKRPIRENEVMCWDYLGYIRFYRKEVIKNIDRFKADMVAKNGGCVVGPATHTIPISSFNMVQLVRNPLVEGKIKGPILLKDSEKSWSLEYKPLKTASIDFVRREVPYSSTCLTWEQQVARYQPADLVSVLSQRNFEIRETGKDCAKYNARTHDRPILPFSEDSLNNPKHITLTNFFNEPEDPTDGSATLSIRDDCYPMEEDYELANDEVFGVVPCITAKEATKEATEDCLEPPLKKRRVEKIGE